MARILILPCHPDAFLESDQISCSSWKLAELAGVSAFHQLRQPILALEDLPNASTEMTFVLISTHFQNFHYLKIADFMCDNYFFIGQ